MREAHIQRNTRHSIAGSLNLNKIGSQYKQKAAVNKTGKCCITRAHFQLGVRVSVRVRGQRCGSQHLQRFLNNNNGNTNNNNNNGMRAGVLFSSPHSCNLAHLRKSAGFVIPLLGQHVANYRKTQPCYQLGESSILTV